MTSIAGSCLLFCRPKSDTRLGKTSMPFVITGSVAYDYLMRYPGRFRDHILPESLDSLSVSFLADSMRRERGGVAANIAYTMRLLGGDPVILATV